MTYEMEGDLLKIHPDQTLKDVFSVIDRAPVTQFFDEATVDKIQKTEDAIVEKLKQEYQKKFGEKMREGLVLQVLRDGKFPSA